MKKTILIAVLAVFGFTQVNAQDDNTKSDFGFSSGNIFLEGNIGYSSNKNNNTETTTNVFNFSPKAGYFISDDFALGVQFGIGSSSIDVDGSEAKNSNFDFGAFGRYYFLDLGNRFKTYTEFGATITSTKEEIEDQDDFKTNGFGIGAGIGINYFIKDNIAISFGLSDLISYGSNKADVDGAKSETNFGLNVNRFNNFFESSQFGLLFILN